MNHWDQKNYFPQRNKWTKKKWKKVPPRSRRGYPALSGSTTKKTPFFCVSSLLTKRVYPQTFITVGIQFRLTVEVPVNAVKVEVSVAVMVEVEDRRKKNLGSRRTATSSSLLGSKSITFECLGSLLVLDGAGRASSPSRESSTMKFLFFRLQAAVTVALAL